MSLFDKERRALDRAAALLERDRTSFRAISSESQTFIVRYQAGPYSGTREVMADDADEAIAKVQARVRREMTLPMYSESYRIVTSRE